MYPIIKYFPSAFYAESAVRTTENHNITIFALSHSVKGFRKRQARQTYIPIRYIRLPACWAAAQTRSAERDALLAESRLRRLLCGVAVV